jgi:hypothetical protein
VIFPPHRIVAQLVKDADLTIEEATVMARRMFGLQGTVAPEDFFHLGQDLAFGGASLIASAGNINQIGVAVTDVNRPVQVTLESLVTTSTADLFITLPSDLASFGAANARFRDTNMYLAKPSAPLAAPAASIITRTAAAAVGQFVGRIPANTVWRVESVLREGFGLTVVEATVGALLEASFLWREKQLRIR